MIRIQRAAQIAPACKTILNAIPIIDFVANYIPCYRQSVERIISESVRKLRCRGNDITGCNPLDSPFHIDGKEYRQTVHSDDLHHVRETGELKGLTISIEVWQAANYTTNETNERQIIKIILERRRGAIEIKWHLKHVFKSIGAIPEVMLESFHGKPLRDFAETKFTSNDRIGQFLIDSHEQDNSSQIAALHHLTLRLRQAA